MTIVASVKVRDGLVLATDSMTQIQGRDDSGQLNVIKTYGNAKKLFQVAGLPLGVMSYGVGNIGPRSIHGFMRDFNRSNQASDVEGVAKALLAFIKTPFDIEFGTLPLEKKPELGFYLAGYSQGKAFAEEWEFVIPKDAEPEAVRSETNFGASWRGIWPPFTRLYKGYDSRIEEELKKQKLWNESVERVFKGFEAQVAFDGMPVQDAVDFAVYIVRTTVGLSQFEVGPPSCGGPLQVATILPDSGFEWVLNPKISVQ
jgi:hypothetical protein